MKGTAKNKYFIVLLLENVHAYNCYTNVKLSTKELRHFKGDPVFKSFAPFYITLNQCVPPSLKYVFQKHNLFLHNLYFLKLIALKIKINHILWRKNIAYYQSLKLNAIARNNKMLESEIGLFRSKYFCNRNDRKKIGFPETRFCNLFSQKFPSEVTAWFWFDAPASCVFSVFSVYLICPLTHWQTALCSTIQYRRMI